MPEGLQFPAQEQWLMSYIDSLERTILQQSAERRLSDKQVQAAFSQFTLGSEYYVDVTPANVPESGS